MHFHRQRHRQGIRIRIRILAGIGALVKPIYSNNNCRINRINGGVILVHDVILRHVHPQQQQQQ